MVENFSKPTSVGSVSLTSLLTMARFERGTMGVNVPSKSRNRIKRLFGIAASLAQTTPWVHPGTLCT